MFIHYNEITKRVTGYTNFIDQIPETWKEPTIEIIDFDFILPYLEYEVKLGKLVHIGKSQETIDDEKAKMLSGLTSAISNLLDNKAKEFKYDNIMSARSYAGYTNPFQTEAQALAIWAANCWVKAEEIEDAVKAGTRAMPTVDELLLEMPVYMA